MGKPATDQGVDARCANRSSSTPTMSATTTERLRAGLDRRAARKTPELAPRPYSASSSSIWSMALDSRARAPIVVYFTAGPARSRATSSVSTKEGVYDGENTLSVSAGASPADGRAGAVRTNAGRVGAAVRVAGADQDDLAVQPRGVRPAADPHRAAARRRAGQPEAGRAADAARGHRGSRPPEVDEDLHRGRASSSCRTRSGRSGAGGRCANPRAVHRPRDRTSQGASLRPAYVTVIG